MEGSHKMKHEGPLKKSDKQMPIPSPPIVHSLPCVGVLLAFPSGTLFTWASTLVGVASPLETFRTV